MISSKMESINTQTGAGENRERFSFKEAEFVNFTTGENAQANIDRQRGAAYINARKDQANRITVEKADEAFDIMIRNAKNIDDRTTSLIHENKGLIRTLFPTKMDRLIAEMERNTVQESMQFRLNLYKLNTQFLLEGIREKYDAGLKMIKAEYRGQVASFMMGKLEGLSKDVQNRQYVFINLVREKTQLLQSMSDLPSTQKRFGEQIEREQDRYFNFLEQLIINFENVIREELQKFN